jgi:hypothetical protein
VGVGFNTLSGVVETNKPTGEFLADLADHTKTDIIARVGLGLRHRIAQNVVVGLDGSIAYVGGFETGNTPLRDRRCLARKPQRFDQIRVLT